MSNAQIIWEYFKNKNLNDYAIAGIMGNLYAESALRPTNLQNNFEKKIKLSDEEYTKQVDNGTYMNFVNDSAGYGLAQWTFYTRKEKLLSFAKKQHKSIGDLLMQLDFLWQELSTNYKASTLVPLKGAKTVQEASNIFLTQFERPADQSDDVKLHRGEYAKKYYTQFSTSITSEIKNEQTTSSLENIKFSNSELAELISISPNRTINRNHIIDTITIHCLVGQATLEDALEWFARPTTQASCNYIIDKDGRIGLCCEEKDRSWCSSSASNDHRAITIEVASDKIYPYAVNDIAYESLIKLLADICVRNNIKELKWQANKNLVGQIDKQNMTVHKWFANKSCPGEYLYSRHKAIAQEVNTLLEAKSSDIIWYRVRKTWENAKSQIGAYKSLDNAKQACDKAGNEYNVYDMSGNIIYPQIFEEQMHQYAVGDLVSIIPGAKYTKGTAVPDWVIATKPMYIRKINKEHNYVISTRKIGAVTGEISAKYLKPYSNENQNNFQSYIGLVTAKTLNVRQGPGTSYKINGTVKQNTLYTIIEEKNGWGRLKNDSGWVSLNYIKKVKTNEQ